MFLSDFGRVCLFSGISGIVTLNGEPVANARLFRTGDRDGKKSDETTTDANGRFEFPPMFERTIAKYLPQEFVAAQKIELSYEGLKYEIWSGIKRKPGVNSESRGYVIELVCELNNEEQHYWIEGSSIHTKCSWEIETDPPYSGGFFENE